MTTQVYNLDGPKEFPFPYPVRAAAQLTVEIVPGGVVSPGDYEVVGVGPTSTQVTVRYPNAPTTGGLQLKISRYVAPERVTVIDDPSDITTVNLNAEFNNIYEALIDFEEFILNLVQQMLDDFQNDVLDPALAEITQARDDAIAAKDAAEAAQQGAEEAEQGATNAWDAFQDRYWGAYPTDPSVSPVGNPPTAGDLYWNTTVNQWRAWDANQGAWVSVTSAVPTYYDRRNYIATEGQTTFEATYDAGFVQVWVNGLLLPPSDYEASTGTEVVLDEGVAAGTEVTIVGLGSVVIGVLDGDIAVVTTLTGTQLLPDALNDRVAYVDDITALRALTGVQEGQAAQITTTGRSGLFRWDSSDLSAEVAADPMMDTYVPPEGQDGSAGAWVRVYDTVNYVGTRASEYASLVSVAHGLVPGGNSYWFGTTTAQGDPAIELGSSNGSDNGSAYRIIINEDGFMYLSGAWCAPMEYTGVFAQATNLVGNFETPTTTPNHWATTPGDTFELPFDGHSLEFYFYSDDRGGVWQITLDGGAQVTTLSTWSASPPADPPRKTILFSGLTDGPHTAVFEFLGDDPDHVPSGGPGTSRGWFRETYDNTGLGIKGVGRIEQTGSRPIMLSPISVVEFAIFAAPSGSGLAGSWTPRHGVDGSTRNITRRIFIDGVERGSHPSHAPQFPEAYSELVIQQLYTAYNTNDAAGDYPMWDGVLTHRFTGGVLTVTHQCVALRDLDIGSGYLAMFPGDYRYADRMVSGTGEEMVVSEPTEAVDTGMIPTNSAALIASAQDCLIACDVSGVPNTLRRIDEPVRRDSVFLQLRTDNIAKVYWKTFDGDHIAAGEKFGSISRYTMVSNDPSVRSI